MTNKKKELKTNDKDNKYNENSLINEVEKKDEYSLLKEKKIIKDNVLIEVKDILRNYGFLGIDIPRVNTKTKSKDNIVNLFNKYDYQKLFNVYDFSNEKLFISGVITNAKSDLNLVEIIMIIKKILNSYKLKNYKIIIHDENIYNLVSYYMKNNIVKNNFVLVPDGSNVIKVFTSDEQEMANISKNNNSITFNITIDKFVDYIIRENKESLVIEKNKRNTLLYVRNQNENDVTIFDKLYDSYLYKHNGIIVYEKDIKKEDLYNYCIKNNIKLVVFFDNDNRYNLIDINELLTNDIFVKTKKLIKEKNEVGEK